MQGRLDDELANAGAGDGGGISTLLVHLGRALGSEPGIARVTTIARALAEPETGFRHASLSDLDVNGVSLERIPFGPAGYVPAAGLWEHRLELERAFEQVLVELGGVDVVHLRFADAGSFAAARVCRRLRIPVVFTAAPDPHGVIAAAERRGELDRRSFPDAELREHYLLRAELVGRLLAQAEAVAVLPRPRAREALRTLIGAPFARVEDSRVHTVAEGISFAEIERAAHVHAAGGGSPVLDRLLERLGALPRDRHGLPLLLSVGRLHRVKGFPLLLEAWAGDDDLHRAFNLVIVGGGLEQPTPEELHVLAGMDEACVRYPNAREGLVLLGHRANGEVAMLLRAARSGLAPLVAPDGIYACASQKEEFGVALLEAMATGLAVVAPGDGGPATYVHEGRTGHTADTSSLESLRAALHRAASSRSDVARATRAERLVRARYTIESMATALAEIYAETAGRDGEGGSVIVLVVVPDFVSHWYPLSAVARMLGERGHDVVVATGSTLAPRVRAEGHRHVEVRLGAGSNAGLSRAGADAGIDAFLAATRHGMVATLRHQAERRRHDLLWEPRTVAKEIGRAVRDVAPDVVLVDQLAFGATATLRGLGVPFVSFLPGHPCQLPARGEIFGYPSLRPSGLEPPPEELRRLRDLCETVSVEFTKAFNDAVRALDPAAEPVDDAFGTGGTLGTLVNYPRSLGGHAKRRADALFVGSCVRPPEPDSRFDALARRPGRPRAYVSLGSFLSARDDILARIAQALRLLGWDAVIATGASDAARLGPLPRGWLVAEELPQIAALTACDVVVCHGGNNTVTEALTAGLPVLAAPFSTDQFAGAADLERAGLGVAIDPGTATPEQVAVQLASLLGAPNRRAAVLGRELRAMPGQELAADAVESAAAQPAAAAVA